MHPLRIPFMDCDILPSQELQRASVTIVDPTPKPNNDLFGDNYPCWQESPSLPSSFSASPHLEDNIVTPVVFTETTAYEKNDKLLSNLPNDAHFELHRIGKYDTVSELFDMFKILFPDEVQAIPLPHPTVAITILT